MNTTNQNNSNNTFSKHPVKNFVIGLFIILIFLIGHSLFAQVGVGNTNPQAQLDISASNTTSPTNQDGILIPRVTNLPADASMTANQNGMMLFYDNTGEDGKGFYYWDDTASDWIKIGSGAEKINDLLDGKSDDDGSQNGSSIFLGLNAGLNDNSSDNKNTGIGYLAINTNTTGEENTVIGYRAYETNRASQNTAVGYFALRGANNVNSSYNTAIGHTAMGGYFTNALTSEGNVAIGASALEVNAEGDHNVAIGRNAMSNSQSGNRSIAIGYNTLSSFNAFNPIVAIGSNALTNYSGNSVITAIGTEALENATDCERCTAIGHRALRDNTNGGDNLALGPRALESNTTGSRNIGLGAHSLNTNSTGNNNLAIGNFAGAYETGSNKLIIDNYSSFSEASTNSASPLIYGEFDSNLVRVNGNLQVGNPATFGYAFPLADGTANQIMTTDGSGQVSFVDASTIVTDTDDQNIQNLSFNNSTNILTVGIENGASDTVDLSALDRDDWSTTGNSGTNPSTNFIGTTDNQELSFRINNNQRMRLTAKGQLEMTNGSNSLFIGEQAGENDNLTDNRNTFIGYQNGFSSVNSQYNTSIGYQAMYNSNNANYNMAVGNRSLYFNTTGSFNTGIGFRSLHGNTTGAHNIGMGVNALYNSQANARNIGIGSYVLTDANNGDDNIAIGFRSGDSDTTSSQNVYIGTRSGGGDGTPESKSGNVFIGYYSGYNATGDNKLYIENSASNTPLIYGEFDNDILRTNGELQVNDPAGSGYAFPIADGTNGQVMITNGAGGLIWSNAAESTTANNGLNEVGNDIRWGGALTQDTNITYGNFDTRFNLNGNGDFIIQDAGTGKLVVLDNGDTVLGGDQYWRDEDTGGTLLGRFIDSGTGGNDGRLQIYENGNVSHDLNSGGETVFNEQGLDRDFRIESDTWQNIFRVDAGNNRIGIGTATPDYFMSVNGAMNLREDVGNGAALLVQGDEALWYNGTYFSWGFSAGHNYFARDVGIGINTPEYKLDVRENIADSYVAQVRNENAGNQADGLLIQIDRAAPVTQNIFIGFRGSGNLRGSVRGNGTGVVYNTTSDRRLKTNISDIKNSLKIIEDIQPRIYEYKAALGIKEYGFIAQELQTIYPQAVSGSPDSNVEEDPMMVDYGRLTPILTAGIKELKNEVDTLKEENAILKEQLKKYESLEARILALENNNTINSTKNETASVTKE